MQKTVRPEIATVKKNSHLQMKKGILPLILCEIMGEYDEIPIFAFFAMRFFRQR